MRPTTSMQAFDHSSRRSRGQPWTRWLAGALVLSLALVFASCTSPTPSKRTDRAPGEFRSGKFPTAEGFAQLAVDDPCRHLGTLQNVSAQVIERLRARNKVTLDEWSCMSDVVKDVNWEVGKQCHQREVEFSEFADAQKEGYAKCLSGKRSRTLGCSVIQVNWRGSASFCR